MPMPIAAKGIAIVKPLGFTLVELVMTLVIVAILSVFALSRLDFRTGFDERSLHDRLKAGLQFARKAAVASRRYVCVSVTNGNGGKVSFTLESAVPESTTGVCGISLTLPTPDTTSGCLTNQICAGSGLSLSADNVSFRFDAQGRLTAGSTVTLSTPGQPGIALEAETGYAH
jgi:MSHA pilin protein MshC